MNFRPVLPIEDVKETGGGGFLFQKMFLHYLSETSAKEAHWSGKQSDPYNVLLGHGYSCLVKSTGWLQKNKSVQKPSSEGLGNLCLV